MSKKKKVKSVGGVGLYMSMYVCLWFGDGVARRCAHTCAHTRAQLVAGTRTNIRARSRAPARAEVENGTAVTLHCCVNDALFRLKKFTLLG